MQETDEYGFCLLQWTIYSFIKNNCQSAIDLMDMLKRYYKQYLTSRLVLQIPSNFTNKTGPSMLKVKEPLYEDTSPIYETKTIYRLYINMAI
jgi:hypothetical protein